MKLKLALWALWFKKQPPPCLSDEKLQKLREIPTVVFFEGLSEATIKGMEKASREIHSERIGKGI